LIDLQVVRRYLGNHKMGRLTTTLMIFRDTAHDGTRRWQATVCPGECECIILAKGPEDLE